MRSRRRRSWLRARACGLAPTKERASFAFFPSLCHLSVNCSPALNNPKIVSISETLSVIHLKGLIFGLVSCTIFLTIDISYSGHDAGKTGSHWNATPHNLSFCFFAASIAISVPIHSSTVEAQLSNYQTKPLHSHPIPTDHRTNSAVVPSHIFFLFFLRLAFRIASSHKAVVPVER